MEGRGSSGSTEPKKGESLRSNTASVSILYTNAQSIVNKINELRSVAANIKPDIILINETWTHQDITNAYLHIKGYEISARKDRSDTLDGRGGGLLVYNRIGIALSERNPDSQFEQVVSVLLETETKPLAINLT